MSLALIPPPPTAGVMTGFLRDCVDLKDSNGLLSEHSKLCFGGIQDWAKRGLNP